VIYFVVPWLIEAFWLWRWVPMHARRLRKQRELDAVFGTGYFDMTQPQSEMYWLLAFGLYHLPLMLVGAVVPNRLRVRFPWLVFGLAMLGTPLLYSGAALWVATKHAEPSATQTWVNWGSPKRCSSRARHPARPASSGCSCAARFSSRRSPWP